MHPGAGEIRYDGVDDTCDDNYGDQDGDGFCVAGYGIYGNGSQRVRAYCTSVGGSCLFTGSRCDMGTPSLGTVNTSGDDNVDGATVGNWYGDATFSCTSAACS